MIKLTGIILIIALCRAWWLIRTSRMPTQEDVQQFEPDRSKNTFEMPVMDEKTKYYKQDTGGHSPPVYVEKNEK